MICYVTQKKLNLLMIRRLLHLTATNIILETKIEFHKNRVSWRTAAFYQLNFIINQMLKFNKYFNVVLHM
jgi:hypothetical protein